MSIFGKLFKILRPDNSQSLPIQTKQKSTAPANPIEKSINKNKVREDLGNREGVVSLLQSLNDTQLYSLTIPMDFSFLRIWGLEGKKIVKGQVLKHLAQMWDTTTVDKIYTKELDEAIETGEYQKYPFNNALETELRAMALGKLTSEDSVEGLIESVKSNLSRVCIPEYSKILCDILDSIPKSSFNREFRIKELANSIINKSEASVGEVDLLALKDLSLALAGEPMETLSLAPGFFMKYLPKLKTYDFDALIFKVKEGKLVELKLWKQFDVKNNLYYSPIKASTFLCFSEAIDLVPASFTAIDGKTYHHKITVINRPEFLTEDLRFYVVVDGCVASPEGKTPVEYEGFAKNTQRVRAGETFLFEKKEGDILETRIYYWPYKKDFIPSIHNHGSVIFGSNDQSFHSCCDEWAYSALWSISLIDRYKRWWSERQKDESFSPSVIAAKIHYFLVDREGKSTSSTDLLKEENYESLRKVVHSITEVNDFTKKEILYNLPAICYYYGGQNRDLVGKISTFYFPLSQRWNVQTYMKDGIGITKEKQNTFYTMLSKKMRNAERMEWFREWAKIKASGE